MGTDGMGEHLSTATDSELFEDIQGWRKQMKEATPTYAVDLMNIANLIGFVKDNLQDTTKAFAYIEELARRLAAASPSKSPTKEV